MNELGMEWDYLHRIYSDLESNAKKSVEQRFLIYHHKTSAKDSLRMALADEGLIPSPLTTSEEAALEYDEILAGEKIIKEIEGDKNGIPD